MAWKPVAMTISDATGSVGNLHGDCVFRGGEAHFYAPDDASYDGVPPPPQETWKLRVEFAQVGDFAPDEVCTFRHVPLLRSDETMEVNQSATIKGGKLFSLRLEPEQIGPGAMTAVIRASAIPRDRQLALVYAIDERGRDLRPRDHDDMWGHEIHPSGYDYVAMEPDTRCFDLFPRRGAKTADFTLALERRYSVEFLARPEYHRASPRNHGASGPLRTK